MKTILLISPYWREEHRWMISTTKLADLWQRLGFRVVVACMGDEQAGVRSRESVSPTLTIYRKKDWFLPDPWNYGIAFGFSGFVRRIIATEKPDIIVINKILFWTSLCAFSLRLRGHRIIQITDALVGMTWWPRGKIPQFCAALYAWTLGWLILLCADRIVFFHPQPAALLHRLGIREKSSVIPTGIDENSYEGKKLRATSEVSRSSKLAAAHPVTVTYVGRLESVKGVDDFLAAAVPLLSEYPTLNIQVVGWYKEGHPLVLQYVRQVRFTGRRDDIAAVLSETDLFVLPSHSEGLSNALMEAMASGCACIASDVGGNAYLLQNGVSGLLFPVGDREALRAHIRRLMQDPAKRDDLGNAAKKRIEEVFSWDIVGRQYEKLFAEYLNTRVLE